MKLWLPIAASGFTFLLLCLLLRSRVTTLALDHPNERSLHAQPVPRIGGLAIFLALVPALISVGYPLVAMLAGALSTLSFFDDRHHLPIALRFAAHALAAALFVYFALAGLTPLAGLLAVLALMWMTNLYNFMDGSDGLAGGMAVIGFAAYALAAWLSGDTQLAIAACCVSGCALAFLCFNFPPARVFMGDAGSVPLGFLAAALGLYGWHKGLWPLSFPLLVFSPFILDASLTLFKRSLQREKIWRAHKNHYYQRLIQMGWGHRKTALAAYALMLLCGFCAFALLFFSLSWQCAILILLLLFYMVLAALIDRRWRLHRQKA